MPVTRSTAAVVSVVKPALVAPVGAASCTARVMFAGIAVGMLALTFEPVWLLVIAHVDVASEAVVEPPPDGNVVMVRDGVPVKLMLLIALTENATDWVVETGCACAYAGAAAATASATSVAANGTSFIKNSWEKLALYCCKEGARRQAFSFRFSYSSITNDLI